MKTVCAARGGPATGKKRKNRKCQRPKDFRFFIALAIDTP
jgi:hypothetical protein